MKKILAFLFATALLLSSCADSKTFKRADGSEFTANAYGWIDRESEKIDGVKYEVCAGNIVWSCILCETVIGPVLLTGFGLYEPVSYTDPALADGWSAAIWYLKKRNTQFNNTWKPSDEKNNSYGNN